MGVLIMGLKVKLLVSGLFLIVFVIGADSFIIAPLLPAIERSFQITVSQAVFSVSIYACCYAIGAPLLGPFGDRYSRKRLLLIGIGSFLIGSLGCALAVNIMSFYVFRAFAGIGAALTLPNIWALIGQTFHGQQLNLIMGITMSALSLSIAIGVPLGAGLAQLANWHLVFWISAVLAIGTLIGLWFVVPTSQLIVKPQRLTYLHSFKLIFKVRRTSLILTTTLVWMLGFYLVYTFLGIYAAHQFGLSSFQVGSLFSIYGFSNFVASFLSGYVSVKLGALRAVQLNGGLSALFIVGLGFNHQRMVLLAICLVLLAFVQGFGVTALNTAVVNLIPSQRSTVMAFNSSFLYLGLTLSSVLGGLLYTTIGFSGICVVASIALLLAVVVVYVVAHTN